MSLYKRNVYSGHVLEQEVYTIGDGVKDIRTAEPGLPPGSSKEEQEARRIAASKRRLRRLVNTNFDPRSFYVTFTLDDDHYVDDFKSAGQILRNYIRRLRTSFPSVVVIAVMGRGAHTGRIHYHLLIARADRAAIESKWSAGKIKRIEYLREHNFYNGVDRGCDYTGLAEYLFGHLTSEQHGKRWIQTRTVLQPIKETPKPILRRYSISKPPKAPEGYELTGYYETIYGYQCFTYVRQPNVPMRC